MIKTGTGNPCSIPFVFALKELQKQKEKQALMDDLRKQIKALNPDVKTAADDSTDATDELDKDKIEKVEIKSNLEESK